jgi:dipeptide/tripeptide permease
MHKPEDRSFIGHPRGLGYLAFTEAWERFSYYGMQSLLVLYMVNRLLTPDTSSASPGSVHFAICLRTFIADRSRCRHSHRRFSDSTPDLFISRRSVAD